MKKRLILIGSAAGGLLVLGGLAGFAVKARADGIPSPNPLYYSGTLTESGSPVNGMRTIGVNLYADGTATTPLCQTIASNTQVTSGRFRIQLSDTCKGQVNANSNAYVEVVDGTASLGRTKIGAVPYAVEADHAINATNVIGPQAQQVVPAGALMFFNLATCPTGWSALTAAQGRYIVGLGTGGTLAGTVGTALSDQENRAVGQHSHTVNDPGHNHGGTTGAVANWNSGQTDPNFDYTGAGATCTRALTYSQQTGCGNDFVGHDHSIATSTTGVTLANAGAVAGTNAPYVQLLACQKN